MSGRIDHMHCPRCGEPMAWHIRPCGATKCVANDCDKPIADKVLGICADHVAILASQRRARYTEPYASRSAYYVCVVCGCRRRANRNPPPTICRSCERSKK